MFHILTNQKLFTKKQLYILITLIFFVLFFSVFILINSLQYKNPKLNSISFSELPSDVVFVPHNHDLKSGHTSSDDEGMRHYARPEDLAAGGPIYGVQYYDVVAVEYIIPKDSITNEAVGLDFPGQNLKKSVIDTRYYDHLHISIADTKYSTTSSETSKKNNLHDIDAYDLHFMLIPHEEELKRGLSCD